MFSSICCSTQNAIHYSGADHLYLMCCRRLCVDIRYAGRAVNPDFGVVGYLIRKLDPPLTPAVLAIFLDPLTETSMRPALLLGDASFAIFSNWPMATPITIITLLPLAMPLFNLFPQQLWLSVGT